MKKLALVLSSIAALTLMSPDAKADLQGDIAEARGRVPQVFRAVEDVVVHAEELDAKARARGIPFTPRLKALGPNALYPMLEVVITGKGVPKTLSPSARSALMIGLFEAIGSVRDERAVPVLEKELDRATDDRLVRATSAALARIGSDAAVAILERAAKAARARGDAGLARERAVLGGLHDCRREAAARLLAARLDGGVDDATARIVLHSLGGVGNAWAWRALPASAESAPTRALATEALLRAYVARSGEVREAAAKALLVIDDPSLPTLLARAKAGASPDARPALDALELRLRDNPARL